METCLETFGNEDKCELTTKLTTRTRLLYSRPVVLNIWNVNFKSNYFVMR